MKHRGGAEHTGLGGGAETLIDGKSTGNDKRDALIKRYSKAVYETFFKGTAFDEGYCEAQEKNGEIRVGIEPSYQWEGLKMIVIDELKIRSYFMTGIAFEVWGSGLASSRRYYHAYKRRSKFMKFIDEWHPKLFPKS